MTPSETCLSLIKEYEQCRLKAYLPTPNDVWTIGWGSTGPGIKSGTTWTQEQADKRFAEDVGAFSSGVNGRIIYSNTTQGQFDAMVSLAYNIGLANFTQSSVLTNHKLGHFGTAALAFSLWNKQRDKKTGQLVVLNGLTKRRAREAALYRS